MFKYGIFVTSLITLFLVCLHVHKGICENDKKYWLRDQQFWPSIQKYRNLLKKSKASVGEDTIKDARHVSQNSRRQRPRLNRQENISPRFNAKIEERVKKPEVYPFNVKQKEVVMGPGHSRESYIRSQGNHQLKGPVRFKKIEKDNKGLSIYEERTDGPEELQKGVKENHDLYKQRDKVQKKTSGRTREYDDVTVQGVGHSRESYIRSQGSHKLKGPVQFKKQEKEFKGLSIYEERTDLKHLKDVPNQLQKGAKEISYQERDKVQNTMFNGLYATTKRVDRFSKGKLRLYSEEKIQKKVEKMRTRGLKKKGRDFDRYKEEKDLDIEEKELEEEEERSKKRYYSSEERDFDRFKKERDSYTKERKREKILRNVPSKEKDYGREEHRERLSVTKGFNEDEDMTSVKIHALSNEKTYESVDMISEEQKQPDIHKLKRVTNHPSIPSHLEKNYASQVLRTVNNEETFMPTEISKRLDSIKKTFEKEGNIVQETIGHTREGNDIVLWKITEKKKSLRFARSNVKKKYVDEPPEKKIVFIVHGLSVMGWHELDCLSKANRFSTLLGFYLENLDSFDIYLIPMANPDGVAKAMQDKWWNKNLSPQQACLGVNLDRNFDVQWNETYGRVMSSCHPNYPGQKPFSELETRAVREVFHRYGHKIVAYFHVHAGSYDASVFKGDAILYPGGYMMQQAEEDRYIDLQGDVSEAMRNTSFRSISVTVDTQYNWYENVVGTSVEYASTVIGIPYTLELVMQIYKDNILVKNPDDREQNAALVEIWQVLIDVIFDAIYRNAIRPSER